MKFYYLILSLILISFSVSAQNIENLGISDFSSTKDGSVIIVNMKVNPKSFKKSLNQRVEINPVIYNSDSTEVKELPAIILAGKNMYYSTIRNKSNDIASALYRAGKGEIIDYSERVTYEPWMDDSKISLNVEYTGCCGKPNGEDLSIPMIRVNLAPRTFAANFSYVAPLDTAEKRFNLSGRANIRFIVNRTNIDWKYANNFVELDSILQSVRAVKDNPDATVESIKLTGYASPEGPYDNNVRLAKGRVEVVKEYVRNNSTFPASVYSTASVPEDWEGLKEWLMTCSFPNKDQMIAFIDDPKVPIRTKNEEFMKKFPKEYPFILANVYPPLRHTDYIITYKVKKYYSVEEIRKVFKERPQNLSLNELFILANSYEQGSSEYDEVFDYAVSRFPNDPIANLNAANSAMNRKQFSIAEKYLNSAGQNAETFYAKGVLYALQAKYDLAENWFKKAVDAGKTEAAAQMKIVKDLQLNKEPFSYIYNDK